MSPQQSTVVETGIWKPECLGSDSVPPLHYLCEASYFTSLCLGFLLLKQRYKDVLHNKVAEVKS